MADLPLIAMCQAKLSTFNANRSDSDQCYLVIVIFIMDILLFCIFFS